MACEQFKNKINSLKAERASLQEELSTAAPGQKPFIASEIKRLNKEISLVQKAYDACLLENGVQPISATLSGTATLTTTDSNAKGPFTEKVSIGIHFGPGRTTAQIVNFPPIVTDPYDTDAGTNITTVKLSSGGSGTSNPDSGGLVIALTLKFDHSIDFPFYEEDSTLPLTLTTGKSGSLQGSPINQTTGTVTLVGSGIFKDGYLGGKTGTIKITGKISPIP